MASGRITLSYEITRNTATVVDVKITMTYYGNGETYVGSPSSNNCQITFKGLTQSFTSGYTTSTSAQTLGSVTFTNVSKTHNTQSLTASGTIKNYSTYYSDPTATCSVSISPQTSYTITYDANGGSGAPANGTKWYGETYTISTTPPTRTGYNFAGWWTASSGGTQYQATIAASDNGNKTLYAHWTAHTRTFKFNGNGNTGGSMNDQVIAYASSGTTSLTNNAFTRTNYNFTGWNTSADGSGTSYSNQQAIQNNTITSTSTINLYAQWSLGYTPPKITSTSFYRTSSSSDVMADDGTYIRVKFNYTYASNGNSIISPSGAPTYQYRAYYKAAGDPSWTSANSWTNITTSTQPISFNLTNRPSGGFAATTQYEVKIELWHYSYQDYVVSASGFVSSQFFTIDIMNDGTGVSIGQSAEAGKFIVGNMTNGIEFNNDLTFAKNCEIKRNYTHGTADYTTNLLQTSTSLGPMTWTDQDQANNCVLTKAAVNYWDGRFGSGNQSFLKYCNNETAAAVGSSGTAGHIIGLKGNLAYNGGAADYVLSQGSSATSSADGAGEWQWQEWNSGKVEIWYSGSLKLKTTPSDTNGVKRREQWVAFPNSYTLTKCSINITGMQNGCWCGCGGIHKANDSVAAFNENVRKFSIMAYGITSAPAESQTVHIYIRGTKVTS